MADRSLDSGLSLDDTLWGHRWGFADTAFRLGPDGCVEVTGLRYAISGTRMPLLRGFVEEAVGLRDAFRSRRAVSFRQRVGPSVVGPSLGAFDCSVSAEDRVLHSHGQATGDDVVRVLYGELARVVDAVVYPRSEEEVVRLIRLAGELGFCLIPYGGGTSVSCALTVPAGEARPVVSLDMRRMCQVEWLDGENGRASVQAGITGRALEAELGRQGYTCGHEPDSIELSTLGGWIATNASGMKKNRYGNIEDLVEGVTLVTPRGELAHRQVHPRVSMGIQPERLVFGSEGNLGVITRAVIRIFRVPARRQFAAFVFRDFAAGLGFAREVGPVPASLRLVDNAQFRFSQALKPAAGWLGFLKRSVEGFALARLGYAARSLAAATVLMEGSLVEVERQTREIARVARRHGGLSVGGTNGQRGYALTYAIAYIRDFLLEYSILGETLESTVPWSALDGVIAAVRRCVEEQHRLHRLPGQPWMSTRITQLYHSGVCLYVTHCYSVVDVPDHLAVTSAIEKAMRAAIMRAGGSISHHHGVGKIRQDFMGELLSPAAVSSVRALKESLDPQNIFAAGNNLFGGDGA